MTKIQFFTNGDNAATFKKHQLFIKNIGGLPVDLTPYVLAFHPTYPSDNLATASIIDSATGNAYGSLPAGSTLQISMGGATPSVGAASSSFASGTIQYSVGGGMTLFKAPTATESNLIDFVQWVQTGTQFEPLAASAKIWGASTTVALGTGTATASWNLGVTTPGATGSANWTFTAL